MDCLTNIPSGRSASSNGDFNSCLYTVVVFVSVVLLGFKQPNKELQHFPISNSTINIDNADVSMHAWGLGPVYAAVCCPDSRFPIAVPIPTLKKGPISYTCSTPLFYLCVLFYWQQPLLLVEVRLRRERTFGSPKIY